MARSDGSSGSRPPVRGMHRSCGWQLTAGSAHPRRINSIPSQRRTSTIHSTSWNMRTGGWWTSTPTRASPAPRWRNGRISNGCWTTAAADSLTVFWSSPSPALPATRRSVWRPFGSSEPTARPSSSRKKTSIRHGYPQS